MGCNVETEGCEADEDPKREVTLSAFYIDQSEVTVAEYIRCMQDAPKRGCSAPQESDFCNYAKRGDRRPHPINCVTWDQARKYCKWVGKRLPTEAEWEKAARGVDSRKYPWGSNEMALG